MCTCILCFTTSVGTLTRQASVSPIVAAIIWFTGSGIFSFDEVNLCFDISYEEKNIAANKYCKFNNLLNLDKDIIPPGDDPNAAADSPLYIPRKPPALKKPMEDWSRVFKVSNG